MKKIAKLTREQEAQLDVYAKKFIAIGLATGPCDRAFIEHVAERAYEVADLKPPPERHWFNSPNAAVHWLKAKGISDPMADVCYGQHDAGWASFYSYMHDVLELHEECALLLPLIDMCQCGWWWPYDECIVFSERPSEIHLDQAGNLHNPKGAALKYPDGYSIYCWHGVSIPEEWTRGKLPSPAKAITWKNIEQRRAACALIGWDKILKHLKAKTLDRDADPEIGELLECNIPDSGRQRFIRVRCGTGRDFVIPCSNDAKTAREGNASTWGVTAEEYAPEVRT